MNDDDDELQPPDFLSEVAKAEFRRVRELLRDVLTPLDRAGLSVYAHLWAEFNRDPERFPADKYEAMRAWADSLGLTQREPPH